MSEGWLWRLDEEHRQLVRRLDRLTEFINSDGFAAVTPEQQDLMRQQHMHMTDYRLVLQKRLALAEAQA